MVSTFGFRGEALSSLCALGKVQIITATKAEAPVGTVLELGVDGRVTNKSGKLARQVSDDAEVFVRQCSYEAYLYA